MAEKVAVVWLNYTDAPTRGYWDQAMVEDLLDNHMSYTGYEFEHHNTLANVDGAIIVMAARNQADKVDKLNRDIKKLKWVILFLTGDEEADFPVEKVKHDNIEIWVMSPRPGRHDKYHRIGSGYPPQIHKYVPEHAPHKDLDWYFAGQITHERREALAEKAEQMGIHTDMNFEFKPSKGFTQGVKHNEYFKKLASAKVAPAPSGPETPDSFRLFEALECACVPIADGEAPKGEWPADFWNFLDGGEPPFPVLRHYDHLQGYIEDMLDEYPARNNRVFAWWQQYKFEMVHKLKSQIYKLTKANPRFEWQDKITILMPSSPAPIHPSTEHIEACIRDTRAQLPDAQIFILLDGVRPEQEHLRANYEEYQRKLLWLCNRKYKNVLPIRFEEFNHQSGMVRYMLPKIKTPLMLFVEHDAPLVPDHHIDWPGLVKTIESGQANVIRLHHESAVHPEHEHMMIGEAEEIDGVPLRKTAQWSQRPHLANTAFYRDLMNRFFTDKSRAFIEHGLYGPCIETYRIEGVMGWNLWKLYMYYPPPTKQHGANIQRSYDLNSRGAEPVFESEF